MAPRPTYETPQVQLGRLMVEARRRGETFEEWWAEAVRERCSLVMTNYRDPPPRCVRWPTDRNDRVTWQRAIYGTKACWRRAYDRDEPLPCERAVALLGDSIDALASVADERACAELADALPERVPVASAA